MMSRPSPLRVRLLAVTLATVGTISTLGPTGNAGAASTASSASVDDLCVNGSSNCVKVTIEEMKRRFRPLARACSHQAVFSLTYLRTTQEYARAAAEPGFFVDVRFVNREDAVFADYYFDAYDDWAANRLHAVPKAWRVAFGAAAAREVSGSGNLLLGMNAHVNRDLPFVLAELGLGRKDDHDKVNVFLRRVAKPLLDELTRRFDPTMDDSDEGYGLTRAVLLEYLFIWREQAWQHAVQLHQAATPAVRAFWVAEIEEYAANVAQNLMETYRYKPGGSGTAERDAYCATHG